MAKPPRRRPKGLAGRLWRSPLRQPLLIALVFLGIFLLLVAAGRRPAAAETAATLPQPGTGAAAAGGLPLKDAAGAAAVQGTGATAQGTGAAAAAVQPTVHGFKVVRELPHDPLAFTQGLEFGRSCPDGASGACADVLWESTGLRGRSSLREVDLATGRVLRSHALPQQDFAEGLARVGDRLYQLTWQSPRTWSYAPGGDLNSPELLATPLADGWGATSDGTHLIVGDSSEVLYFLDPGANLAVARQVSVTDGGRPVRYLNELEWVGGLIYANVWMTDCLAVIDPATGAVRAWVDIQGLKRTMLESLSAEERASAGPRADVLNGIAHDPATGRLWVTGKLWPRIFEVQLDPGVPDPAGHAGDPGVAAFAGAAGAADARLEGVRQRCIVDHSGIPGLQR